MTFAGYIESQSIVVPSGIAVQATNDGGGPTAVSITAGTYTHTTLCSHFATRLNAVRPGAAGHTWTVTPDTSGTSPTGKVTIAMSVGNLTITWTSTDFRDVLGFTSDPTAVTSATGASQARGIFIPDCPLGGASDIKQAPDVIVQAVSMAPTGEVFVAVGPRRYELRGLRYSHLAPARVWKGEESTTNQSWQRFWRDINGLSHAWFTLTDRKVKLVDHRAVIAGSNESIASWYIAEAPQLAEIRMSSEGYTGWWVLDLPRITSAG